MLDETWNSVRAAGRALRAGEVTSAELLDAATAAADGADEALGVYLTRFDESAVRAAQRADAEFAAGVDRGPLQGIPIGVKDTMAVTEGPTTAQSLVLEDWGDGVDATVVARIKAAGGVICGKTTTMEFACGLPDESKPFPIPRNPWDVDCWAGGSSSGTASGIATGMFLAGLGSDTAGSIRMPAAFCGVSGLMPTFGRVPGSGCVPLAYTLDRVGPMARTADDCALLLEVVSGADRTGAAVGVDAPFSYPDFEGDLTGLRLGVVRDQHFPADADPAAAGVFDDAVTVLEGLGAETIEVRLPYWSEMIAAVFVTAGCEGLAHHRADLAARWVDFTVAARGLLATGAMFSGADYVQAQRVRRVGQDGLDELFTTVDVVVCPTAVVGAPRLDELATEAGHQDNEAVFSKIYTPYWNGVGNPVLAIPIGCTGDGRPLSMQLAGNNFDESTILRVGVAFQQHTAWHRRVPVAAARAVESVG